mmetsp:Transcript_106943/g.190116  ORF Transcript_106943/g.190116 Transcript_106943/m.190116 type:complete len:531 (-) Transcript_106943:32-1624(-)
MRQLLLCTILLHFAALSASCTTSTSSNDEVTVLVIDCLSSITTITCKVAGENPTCDREVLYKTTTTSTVSLTSSTSTLTTLTFTNTSQTSTTVSATSTNTTAATTTTMTVSNSTTASTTTATFRESSSTSERQSASTSGQAGVTTISGTVTFAAEGTSQEQAEAAVATALKAYLDLSSDIATNALMSSQGRRLQQVWVVTFEINVGASTALQLREDLRVSDEAGSFFSVRLRAALQSLGSAPPDDLLLQVALEDTRNSTSNLVEGSEVEDPEDSSMTVVLVLFLLLLVCGFLGCSWWYLSPKLRQAIEDASANIDPAEVRAAHQEIQELEQRRWAMRESGLASQIPYAVESKWSGTWSWTGAESESRTKQYKFDFQPAGKLEGHGLGAGGTGPGSRGWKLVLVGGTYDYQSGRLLWREVAESFDQQGGIVLECEAQLLQLEQGHELTGQFFAFDTLGSRRLGRGRFTVTTDEIQIMAPVTRVEHSPRSAADARGENPPAAPRSLGRERLNSRQAEQSQNGDTAPIESDAV